MKFYYTCQSRHWGILREDGTIDNPASVQRLAQHALAYAKAGIK